MVREILLHPAKPMAWIRGGSRQGLEEFYYILLNLWLGSIAVWIRDGHVAMLLHASRFTEMLDRGMSQAAMLLHASRFVEMLDIGMSQAEMLIVCPGVPS